MDRLGSLSLDSGLIYDLFSLRWLKREIWHRSVFILKLVCEIDRVFTTCHKWVVSSLSDDVLSNTLS